MQTTARIQGRKVRHGAETYVTQLPKLGETQSERHNWPIGRQNREVTKVSDNTKRRTGREAVQQREECDINEYERNVQTNTGNSSGRLGGFGRLQHWTPDDNNNNNNNNSNNNQTKT